MNIMFYWQEQYLTSAERTLHMMKRNIRWTTKTGTTIKCLAVYQVMWLLITTVISNHPTIRKELLHVVLHTAISTLGVYQDSRFWRNTSDCSICSLSVMEENFPFYGPPLQWTFLSRRSPYHTNVHFTRNHANVTVPITLKRLMTVRHYAACKQALRMGFLLSIQCNFATRSCLSRVQSRVHSLFSSWPLQSARAALCKLNALLVRVRLSCFQKLMQTRSTCRNNTKKCLGKE